MLSRKVTCAIMVLCELYMTRPEEKTGRKKLRRTTLAETCDMGSQIFRQVMLQLYINKYINIVNASVILICNPAVITIYDLFVIFHGGIPVGEGLVLEVDLYTERKYQKIALLEEDVRGVSRKYFERRTVASMINRLIYSKRSTQNNEA